MSSQSKKTALVSQLKSAHEMAIKNKISFSEYDRIRASISDKLRKIHDSEYGFAMRPSAR